MTTSSRRCGKLVDSGPKRVRSAILYSVGGLGAAHNWEAAFRQALVVELLNSALEATVA